MAAPYTPFKNDSSLNLDIIDSYAERLKKDKLVGVFVGGTTGEGMLLDIDERMELSQAWIKHKDQNFKVLVHVGSTSYKQSQTLASHAQSIGADAIGCLGPMFLKPQTEEQLVLFCAEVASAAPNIPFYYYHLPDISGIDLNMFEFLQKISNSVSNFVGIKYTHDDLKVLLQCLQLDKGKWDILHGFDEILLAGLSLGVKGAIGSTYNYLAPVYYEVIQRFNSGDLPGARVFQHKSATLIELLFRFGGAVVAGKAIMKMIGIDCGPMRLPAKTLSGSELVEFENELKKIGFFNWIKT